MKKALIFLLLILLPYSLFSGDWKISLNASLQIVNFNDLEANKDFWNIALYQTIQHKRELGEDIELPQKIDRMKYSPAMGISIEREINRIILNMSLDKYHGSFNPYLKVGDLASKNYEVTNSVKETIDIFSPSFSLGYKIVNMRNFSISFNLGIMLNFFSFKYSQDFNWTVFDDTGSRQIINVKETNYTKLTKLIPSFNPTIRSSLRFNRLGFSIISGFNFGKVSNINANVDYFYSMSSVFHSPIEYSFSGETELWIGERWVELMGYDYWVRTHLYGDEKPQQNPRLKNIRPLEINISGFFLKFSLSFYF